MIDFTKSMEKTWQPRQGSVGILEIRRAIDVLNDNVNIPNPTPIYKNIFVRGQVACLFADTNSGKTVLATQIAIEYAREHTNEQIVYFDFEMSDKAFQRRYTSETGVMYPLPKNLYRVSVNYRKSGAEGSEFTLKDVESAIGMVRASVVVVDSLMFLGDELAKADVAKHLMAGLFGISERCGVSILALGHTTKRDLSRALTQNDLAGSKNLANRFDSIFAIGRCAKDESLRYVKHVKSRDMEMTFGADNVILYRLEKNNDGFLHFEESGCEAEWRLLRTPSDEDREMMIAQVNQLRAEGKRYKDIAEELNISIPKVQRILKNEPRNC